MHLSGSRESTRLPKRFPVGTTYVVEGRNGANGHLCVFSRYVVLPGGERINLSTELGSGTAPIPRRRAGSEAKSQNGAKLRASRAGVTARTRTQTRTKTRSRSRARTKKIVAGGGTARQGRR